MISLHAIYVACAVCLYLMHLADAKQQAQHTLCPYTHTHRARPRIGLARLQTEAETNDGNNNSQQNTIARPNETETEWKKHTAAELKRQQQKQSNSTIYTSLNKTLQAIRSASSTPAIQSIEQTQEEKQNLKRTRKKRKLIIIINSIQRSQPASQPATLIHADALPENCNT